MILHGDSIERLKEFPDNYFDSVATDPPYGLSFMGKKWDYDVPSVALWVEVLRVLKPGGHLLSFGGTRTYHRMVVNIEDAGFEIRDQVMWLYGSGFPKSMDVSKAIDKAAGAEREVIAEIPHTTGIQRNNSLERDELKGGDSRQGKLANELMKITKPATDAAKQWQGWGTALKPANEPIVLARKPLSESTVAKNVLKWGTGALNIDASRIGSDKIKVTKTAMLSHGGENHRPWHDRHINSTTEHQGRWPANLLLDETAAEMLDEQSGVLKSGARKPTKNSDGNGWKNSCTKTLNDFAADSGGASRFFYVAKASKRERNAGLEGMPEALGGSLSGGNDKRKGDKPQLSMRANHHPTVKPIKLMEYLCRLITPPSGIVLDPFCGSGSTGVAAKNLGFGFVGIEREEEYVQIAERRLVVGD